MALAGVQANPKIKPIYPFGSWFEEFIRRPAKITDSFTTL
jgi:hypothetical protein